MPTPDKPIEIGLVLQGGGALGAFEFGAVIALLELMDAIEKAGRAVRLVAVTRGSICSLLLVSAGTFSPLLGGGLQVRRSCRRRRSGSRR